MNASREVGIDLRGKDTFHKNDVGIFFGEPDKTVPDPYFDGRGPERTGCTFCGSCMVGCPVGAKNTLDRNYLYLAEGNGARRSFPKPKSLVCAPGTADTRS
jgi:cholesterol oxidase